VYLELERAVAEIAVVKMVVSKSSRKIESLEKEVRQVRALVEGIHSEQTGSRLVERVSFLGLQLADFSNIEEVRGEETSSLGGVTAEEKRN